MDLGHFPTEIDRSSLDLLSEPMAKYKLVKKPVAVDEVVRGE